MVLSGGMDSTTALYQAVDLGTFEEIQTITFDYGSKHNHQEYLRALAICARLKIKNTLIKMEFINKYFKSDLLKSGGDIPEGHYADKTMKRTVVPFRNGIMLSIAAGFAESIGATHLILGNHVGDHAIYPDCRSEFTTPMAKAIRNGTYNEIELLTPFGGVDKTEIVKLGAKLGVPYELTYSCYKGGKKHCGKCGTCTERIEAFRLADISDPTDYSS